MATNRMIAHAVTDEDEDGTPYMGDRGDQKGYELCACKWYDYPWTDVYRLGDETKAKGVADFMERAITNGYVGYDQNRDRRKGFFDAMSGDGVDFCPDHLDYNRGTDCCGLVYTAIYSQYRIPATDAEKDLNDKEIFGIPTTGLINKYLMNDIGNVTKYAVKYAAEDDENDPRIIIDPDFVHSDAGLVRGDILLADGHIAVWI